MATEKFPTPPAQPDDQPAVEHPEPIKIPEGALKKPTTVFETPEGKKTEFVEIPEEEQKEGDFDVGKALEHPGFFDFLNKYSGTNIEQLDKAETQKMFEAFEVSSAVKDFYKETIKKDIGIEIEDKEIQASLESYFVNSKDIPQYAENIKSYVKEYHELPKRIAKKEEELNKLGGRERLKAEEESFRATQEKIGNLGVEVGKLTRMKEMSESMSGIKGFFNLKGNPLTRWIFLTEKEKPEAAEARKRTVSSWQNEIKTIERAVGNLSAEARKSADRASVLAALDRASEQLKENMDALKNLFFGGYFDPARDILALSQKKLKERLNDLASPKKGIKKLEAGLEFLEAVGKKEVEYLGKEEIGKFRTGFDKLIERKTSQNIRRGLGELRWGEAEFLGNFEKQIKKFFSVEKLGTKDKKNATDFIRKRLEAYIKMAVPPKGETAESFRAKKVAIKVLLLKLGHD
jgi:hypothetical protein